MAAGIFRGFLPPGAHLPGNIARNTAELAFAVSMFILLDTIGLGIHGLLSIRNRHPAVRLTAAPLAYGLLSLSMLGTVLLGLWFATLLFALLALLLAASLRHLGRSASYWKAGLSNLWGDGGRAGKALLVMLSLFLIVPLFVPDLTVDAIKYHLSCPQQYLAAHKLYGNQVYWLWKVPLVMEYPYAIFLSLGAESSLKILVMLLAVTTTLGVIKSLPFTLRPILAFGIAGAALLFHRTAWVITTAKNDLGVLALGMAVTGLVVERLASGGATKHHPGRALLAGFLLGMFAYSKFMVLPFAFTLALLYLSPWKNSALPAVLLCAGGLLTALPWSIKSFLFTQDPLYPYFTMSFPGQVAANFGSHIVSKELRSFIGYESGLPSLALVAGQIVPMMVLLLAGLPALLLYRGKSTLLPVLAVGLGLLLQILLHRQSDCSRYAFYATVLWNISGLAAVLGRPRSRQDNSPADHQANLHAISLLAAAIMMGFIKAFSFQTLSNGNLFSAAEYLSGRMDTAGYRARGLFAYGLVLPLFPPSGPGFRPGTSIIEYGDHYSLEAPFRIRNDGAGPHPIWQAVSESPDLTRLAIRFRQMNARFILYNTELAAWDALFSEPCPWSPRMLGLYSGFVGRYFRVLGSSECYFPNQGTYWLFEVSRTPANPPRQAGLLPGTDRNTYAWRKPLAFRDLPAAEAAARELLEQSHGALTYETFLGLTYIEMGRYAESYRLLKRCVDAGVIREKNLLWCFSLSAQLGKLDENRAMFREVLKWHPSELPAIRKICATYRLNYQLPGR